MVTRIPFRLGKKINNFGQKILAQKRLDRNKYSFIAKF